MENRDVEALDALQDLFPRSGFTYFVSHWQLSIQMLSLYTFIEKMSHSETGLY